MKTYVQIVLFAALLCAAALPSGAQELPALAQRTESLRAQLRDVTDKEAALQARMQQLDEDLKPENIRNRTALTGTLDADKLRDQVRQQLEGEKARAQQQLDLLATSRAHLEAAITETEAAEVRQRAAALAPTQSPAAESSQPVAQPAAPASAPRASQRRLPRHRPRARKPKRRSR